MMEAEQRPDKKLSLVITTPRGVKFDEVADMIIFRAIDGDIGILPGHTPMTTPLGDGILRIVNEGRERLLAVFGGIADIQDQRVRIFSTIAQRPDEIDVARAEEDRREAEAAYAEAQEETMMRRLQIHQVRALVRLRVSQTDFFDLDEEDDEA